MDGSVARFCAAHFLAGHPKCGRLHGHNYHVSLRVESSRLDDQGFVMDFGKMKSLVKAEVARLDHSMLLPGLSPGVRITTRDEALDVIVTGKHVPDKRYTFPAVDCRVLPVPAITSEHLARYLHGRIAPWFDGATRVVVQVSETNSCSAGYAGRAEAPSRPVPAGATCQSREPAPQES